ncbi:MarR family winged helix-turn-helix transcriptional regulator [Roseateles toxinivorans]|uniref:DNA-binding MarR family transcriptional regulator n=1 Tax=Roseateles toxinivorans TaxID=270368 RepID=A0A4R6QUB7_9BURK|nr:MarR family transcriptional regulator [Roseateles toxinivorans]TDP74916.1 DNA-binding MarR family transcriptional regulator [Roseateles toxinivorans]
MSTDPSAAPAPAAFYSKENYGPEASVGLVIKQVMQSIVQQADAHLEAYDLTHAQWKPLLRLHQLGACTPAELARDLSMDAGAVTRLIDRLERKGLCSRERSSEDRRVVNVALTEEGRRSAALVPGVLSDVMNGHLAGFSHQEWQLLMQFLKRMLLNGEAMRAEAIKAVAHPNKKD